MQRESQYDVYVSFASPQRDLAHAITEKLRSRGCSVFSLDDVAPGENWTFRQRDALAESRFVVILMSSSYFVADHELEWSGALQREESERRVIVLPLMCEDAAIPVLLSAKVWIDFRGVTPGTPSFSATVDRLWNAMRQHVDSGNDPLPGVKVPEDLIRSCRTGECVLFAGAGLSARAGGASWNQFLHDLLRHAQGTNAIEAGYARSLDAALHEGERNSVADGLTQMLGRQPLQEFLRTYYRDVPLSAAHKTLQGIPFSSVITSNYDRLLEQTFPEYAAHGLYTIRDATALLDALSQRRPFILKLWGRIEWLETLLFAPIEYRAALSANIPFANFMEGIFFSRTFLFVGLSLEGIQDFLSGFVFRGISPRKHFALVAVSGSAWKARADLLQRRYNIEVIAFRIGEGYPEVDVFLKELRAAMPIHESGTVVAAIDNPAAPGIRRLTLENIGPFEWLEVDFQKDQNWKVLLGDNGVGKSTILKAIAVAIVGNDARSFAGRLVRSGKTKGRITLFTEKNPDPGYVTEILTTDTLSQADVLSIPSRPLEAEGWLALGFPPLRVVTWSHSTGPQPVVQKGRPTCDDLLPLISGEVDPRMDRLKQWIVNLDASEKTGPALTLSGHDRGVRSIAFSPDGGTLISGSIDGVIRLWDCWSGALTRSITAHSAGVNSVALSGDGRILASASYDKRARTWTASGDHMQDFSGSHSQVMAVVLNGDGSRLISGSEGGSIRVWNAEGQRVNRWNLIGESIWCMALSPDGAILASGTYSGKIHLYAASGELQRIIVVGRGAVMGLAWLPGGNFVCGSRNGPVEIWNPETGVKVREYPASDTTSVAVSLDGRVIASGSNTGEVKVWETESGREIMRVRAHLQTVWNVALSPNGRTLASASEDHTVKLWNLPGSMPAPSQMDTIRRFFGVLGDLMDRSDIEFLEVTRDYRVMVRTADAPAGVPIELLSQGMTSLFGWVGVLCQRLKETLETPSQDHLPTNAFALVLIDELDAHMHPAWQQVLVSRLSDVFPKVQFIATTHSPLVVADLPPEGIFALRREECEIVYGVDTEAVRIRGLRVDQILMTDLFGLTSVRGATVERNQSRYLELALQADRSIEQDEEFRRLAADLNRDLVRPEETREALEAARLIEESLDGKIRGTLVAAVDEASREKLLTEIRAQMLELKSAFRRYPD